jgi:hypothetical protein
MTRNRIGCGVLVCLALVGRAPGAGPVPPDESPAARIDRHLAAAQARAGVIPAPAADDAEFLRRVHLDIAGRIPTVSESRRFLDSKDPDKRHKLIDALLEGPHYVAHYTVVWRSMLLPESEANIQARLAAPVFENWLRRHLIANTPYDRMVRDLLTAPLGNGANPRGVNPLEGGDQGASGFYLANEFLPENLASATSRLFLGVKLGCAQCHDHPFAEWKRDQFWSYAAFFASIRPLQRTRDGSAPVGRNEITIPRTGKVVKAKFLDGTVPTWTARSDSREVLADWVTSPKNPYFARAAVNRLWSQLFGIGLVDPVDEMVGTGNECIPSHPEILDELTREFVAHKYDLKFLIRTLTNTSAYQRSSRNGKLPSAPRQFAQMQLRGLTPEQLYDSLTEAVGDPPGTDLPSPLTARGVGGPREEFLSKFSNSSDRPTETQTSILQALALMNGRYVGEATSLTRSRRLAAILDFPAWTTHKKLETLYLAALTRRPTPREIERFDRYLAQALAEDGKTLTEDEKERRGRTALADLFWALLNSSEFYLNH